ncbi:2-C-methyl-D-erythritol 4-phosphate cytidylyltransferase [Rhizomonospora bruguierae]|uniref:2-C-methyl-D-erythritol 4-phosphate cytidylyltransferase n=1 Tax=Rhizomonospora bruguierae TaxID=1581705 RepID=UPI001BD0F37F|nr:2-C-methyl-D-erythritol 4-phosphate cytidylyltransferase [Micromonospora sp. NBRC 107566]
MTAVPEPRGDVAVLVPAAGLGLRLGPGAPKALRPLAGEPLLVHAVRRLAAAPSVGTIVVAAPPEGESDVRRMLAPVAPVTVVPGGATRQESVAAALAAVPAPLEIVLVHDAARALTPPALIEAVAAAVRAGHDAVIPVLPVVDTIKEVDARERVVGTVDRSGLRAVQTPQGFRRSLLAAAHGAAVDALTDDAGLVEELGVPVACVPGSEWALKITRPVDLAFAEALLRMQPAAGPHPRPA